MIAQIACPDCGVIVARCDNAVLLDLPAVEWDRHEACWTVMSLGPMQFAAAGGPRSPDGRGHTLHDHQPEERDGQ